MLEAIIAIGVTGIVLFILSFFMHDKIKDLEGQVEEISISSMQENYHIKQKLRILEEELLTDDLTAGMELQQTNINSKQPLITTIREMREKGYSISQIAEKTRMSDHDILSIIHQFK
ncbi:hypothetical protein [Thalassobacillus pellis]|uniref:hypothetical protein n=1 Tax=Thalassobacillus pellis TaxID=748008 RepID=UPI001960AA28|nr:hypothetical protein [Thalassobacillus pellis]MBM7552279.1 putative transcriptional regulator [Thalassobacillus pellis]